MRRPRTPTAQAVAPSQSKSPTTTMCLSCAIASRATPSPRPFRRACRAHAGAPASVARRPKSAAPRVAYRRRSSIGTWSGQSLAGRDRGRGARCGASASCVDRPERLAPETPALVAPEREARAVFAVQVQRRRARPCAGAAMRAAATARRVRPGRAARAGRTVPVDAQLPAAGRCHRHFAAFANARSVTSLDCTSSCDVVTWSGRHAAAPEPQRVHRRLARGLRCAFNGC